jgi:hypothetical protein
LRLKRGKIMDKSFFVKLVNVKFDEFITRKVASVFYVLWLVGLGVFVAIGVVAGLIAMASGQVLTGLGTIVGAPLLAFVILILVRLAFEASVALVAIAENTKPRD